MPDVGALLRAGRAGPGPRDCRRVVAVVEGSGSVGRHPLVVDGHGLGHGQGRVQDAALPLRRRLSRPAGTTTTSAAHLEEYLGRPGDPGAVRRPAGRRPGCPAARVAAAAARAASTAWPASSSPGDGRRGAAPARGAVADGLRLHRRPARREDPHAGRGRPLRRPGRRGPGALAGATAVLAGATAASNPIPGAAAPGQHLGQGHGPRPAGSRRSPRPSASPRPLARLGPILARGPRARATIHIDTEHDEVKDPTFELLRALGDEFPDGPALGCVVQAYRNDAYADLRDLVAWSGGTLASPLQIRLVKGAYWDAETVVAKAEGWPVPVFEEKAETDANYERCARHLVETPPARPAGVRQPQPPQPGLRRLAAAGPPACPTARSSSRCSTAWPSRCTPPCARSASACAFYAPVGELVPGMAYLVRRLLENTSNESFLAPPFAEGASSRRRSATPPAPGPRGPAAGPTGPSPATPRRGRAAPRARVDRPPVPQRAAWPSCAARRRARLVAAVGAVEADAGLRRAAGDRRPGRPHRRRARLGRPGPDRRPWSCRSGLASARRTSTRRSTRRSAALAGLAAARRPPSGRPCCSGPPTCCAAAGPSWPRSMVFEAGKPMARPTPTWPRPSTSASTTAGTLRRGSRRPSLRRRPASATSYRYQPRGIGVVIAPWNFPLAIPCGMVAAALVTGNTVLFKPAEQTPGIAYRLVQMLHEAGVPPGRAGVPARRGRGGRRRRWSSTPTSSFVAFTGSRAVGLTSSSAAAVHQPGQRHVKRVVAEMGGKNAIIVDTDADLDSGRPGHRARAPSATPARSARPPPG